MFSIAHCFLIATTLIGLAYSQRFVYNNRGDNKLYWRCWGYVGGDEITTSTPVDYVTAVAPNVYYNVDTTNGTIMSNNVAFSAETLIYDSGSITFQASFFIADPSNANIVYFNRQFGNQLVRYNKLYNNFTYFDWVNTGSSFPPRPNIARLAMIDSLTFLYMVGPTNHINRPVYPDLTFYKCTINETAGTISRELVTTFNHPFVTDAMTYHNGRAYFSAQPYDGEDGYIHSIDVTVINATNYAVFATYSLDSTIVIGGNTAPSAEILTATSDYLYYLCLFCNYELQRIKWDGTGGEKHDVDYSTSSIGGFPYIDTETSTCLGKTNVVDNAAGNVNLNHVVIMVAALMSMIFF